LREGHAQELIHAREAYDVTIAIEAINGASKRLQRQVLHELREHIAALVHGGALEETLATLAETALKSVTPEKSEIPPKNQSIAANNRDFSRTVLGQAREVTRTRQRPEPL